MRTPDRLPDEALDTLLDGSPSEEADGTLLAAYLDAVRHDAVTTEPRPSTELGVVLAEGLDAVELEARDLTTTVGAGAISWPRRGRLVLRVLAAKFAALGILGKAAAAGAAVTVAASGAGAAGVLPPPAQSAFNEVIGREAPEDVPEEADGADGADEADEADGSSEGAETPPETPADTSDTAPLDGDLSDDATGRSDGEPGVDGREVADDASDGRSDAADGGEVEQRRDEPEDTPAGDRVDDTPADEVRNEAPPTPAPARDRAAQDAADHGDVEQRPDESPAASHADRRGRHD